MFDTPVAPVYFAVVFLIHPQLGIIVLGSGAALVIMALLDASGLPRSRSTRRTIAAPGRT